MELKPMLKPLTKKKYLLEKYPGKGGWTYARIPEIALDKSNPFGWKKVRGNIDGFEISKYHLMSMGDGHLFLPVKAEIRKKIKKQEGDWVMVELYADTEPLEVPEEFWLCLADEPKALRFFKGLRESEQKYYLQWIYSAKKEETKINRMAKCLDRLSRGLTLYAIEK